MSKGKREGGMYWWRRKLLKASYNFWEEALPPPRFIGFEFGVVAAVIFGFYLLEQHFKSPESYRFSRGQTNCLHFCYKRGVRESETDGKLAVRKQGLNFSNHVSLLTHSWQNSRFCGRSFTGQIKSSSTENKTHQEPHRVRNCFLIKLQSPEQ